MADLQKQYLDAGGNDSAARIAQPGLVLANRLIRDEEAKLIINRLVGKAIESMVLTPLDQATR
jgi:hypothetical protein